MTAPVPPTANRLATTLPLVLLFLLLVSCSPSPGPGVRNTDLGPGNATEAQSLRAGLYRYSREWRNTPYRSGGMNKHGIDCSGLVHVVFLGLENIRLPRTVEELQELGEEVSRDALRPGDLLFFDTGLFSEHVGIYIENGRFLHASSSRGVTISSLDNVYWRRNFEMAKRLDISRRPDV